MQMIVELPRGDRCCATRSEHLRVDVLTDAQMEKTVLRGDHQWTIAGYLWSIYSHRAFHVGNMDIYLRERHVVPPNYYPAIMR